MILLPGTTENPFDELQIKLLSERLFTHLFLPFHQHLSYKRTFRILMGTPSKSVGGGPFTPKSVFQ